MYTKEFNKPIAMNWINAFNEHDLAKLIGLYGENAIHYSPKLKLRKPETKGWIIGKQQLMDWWADAFERLPGLRYQLENLLVDDDQIFMEYIRRVPGEMDMRIAELLKISNGLIIQSTVYHG